MFRFKLVLLGIGCAICFIGYQEYRGSEGTTAEPADVDLASLERGAPLTNNHVRLGKHIAVFPGSVYFYRQSKYSTEQPNAGTAITEAYYLVISTSHKFVGELRDFSDRLDALEAAVGEEEGDDDENNESDTSQTDIDVSLEDLKMPDLSDFHAVVKTKQFDTIGSIPESYRAEESVQGLVINRIASLNEDESNLIRQSFPGVDLSKVLILEADRQPAGLWKSFGMIGGGVALCLLGVYLMIPKREAANDFRAGS